MSVPPLSLLSVRLAALAALLSLASAAHAVDVLTVGTATAHPGGTVEVPVFVRDVGSTPLGLDQPAGNRIQGLVFKVSASPAASVASLGVSRAGVTASLTPLFESVTPGAGTVSYLASFSETTDPIPFSLDGPEPGDLVATLVIALSAGATPGTLSLTLDEGVSELSNQAGAVAENMANGGLALVHGSVDVLRIAAAGLDARAQSTSAVRLTWIDPQATETGFRIERSPDASSWTPVAAVGPDEESFLDSGLPPASFHYYRVVAVSAAGDGPPSNVAAVSTFPAVASKVCFAQVSDGQSWARLPSPAYKGPEWAVAWQARQDQVQDDIFFQLLDAGAHPLGSPVQVTATDMDSQFPVLRWNGSHFGLLWYELMRGEPGQIASGIFFALLGPDGGKVRGDVRVMSQPPIQLLNADLAPVLVWDGTHWGVLTTEVADPPFSSVVYRRLSAGGDVVLGPVAVSGTPSGFELDVAAAWSPELSKLGTAWIRVFGTTFEVVFQLVEEATGAAEGPPVAVREYSSHFGDDGLSLAWDGSGWALAWTEIPVPADEAAVWLQRLDAAGSPLGPPQRVSDPPENGVFDEIPALLARPGGGYSIFVSSSPGPAFDGLEIGRLQADASGAREGTRTLVSDDDGFHSSVARIATDGSRVLAAYNDNRQGSLEIAGVLLDAAGGPPLGSPVDLTSGHSPGNPINVFLSPANPEAIPFEEGFLVFWTDASSGTNRIETRIVDGAGGAVQSLPSLPPRAARGRPGVAAQGHAFAMAWKAPGNKVLFALHDAAGEPLTGEVEIAADAAGRPEVAMAFSGEVFGVFWHEAGSLVLQKVAPDGSLVGPKHVLFGPVFGPGPQVQWVGRGWAVVWHGAGNDLYYALVGPNGEILVSPVRVTAAVTSDVPLNQFHLLWTGEHLGLAWSELRGSYPPGRDLFFTVLGLDGILAFPPVTAVSGPLDDLHPRLYWADGRFHLVHNLGFTPGVREIEILPDGTVLPGERFWTSRSGNPAAAAFNGATLGIAMVGEGRNLYFETTACLADGTPPACPALGAASQDGRVQLSWTPVDDPESGLWRYDLYRDGRMLAELFPETASFADGGFVAGTTHVYELRAMNRAFQESEGCSTLSFSTLAGDANGDGALDVADLFYLINTLLAGGPPPAGDADANGDGAVTVTDLFYLINYLFAGGPQPLWLGRATIVPAVRELGKEPLPW